jgi:hypothetical protein
VAIRFSKDKAKETETTAEILEDTPEAYNKRRQAEQIR